MSESERSREILDEFYSLLERQERSQGFQVSILAPESRVAEHLFLLTGSLNAILYVKVRSEPPPFWGLTANRIEYLEKRQEPWVAVLLFEQAEYGFLLGSQEIQRMIGAGHWRIAADGDYKVNEYDLRGRGISNQCHSCCGH